MTTEKGVERDSTDKSAASTVEKLKQNITTSVGSDQDVVSSTVVRIDLWLVQRTRTRRAYDQSNASRLGPYTMESDTTRRVLGTWENVDWRWRDFEETLNFERNSYPTFEDEKIVEF